MLTRDNAYPKSLKCTPHKRHFRVIRNSRMHNFALIFKVKWYQQYLLLNFRRRNHNAKTASQYLEKLSSSNWYAKHFALKIISINCFITDICRRCIDTRYCEITRMNTLVDQDQPQSVSFFHFTSLFSYKSLTIIFTSRFQE